MASDLPSLHSCPFTLQVVERGPWQAVVMTCKLAYFSQWSGQTYPDSICRLSRCVVSGRVPLLEGVRIGEARHMYSWGNPDEGNPDENACHVLFRKCVPRVIRRRGPYKCWGLASLMIHVVAKWMHDLNQYRFLIQSYLQKASRQGVRTHPPMVLSAMVREISQLAFF